MKELFFCESYREIIYRNPNPEEPISSVYCPKVTIYIFVKNCQFMPKELDLKGFGVRHLRF
jgi:hypothetical protein